MAQESDDRYQRRSSDDRERPSRPRGEGRPRGPRRFPRRRMDPLSADGIQHVDYKDVPRLRGFLSDMGKISPRRKTGVSAKHQRSLATAIKRARLLALLPYTERERDTRSQGGSGGRRGGPRGGRGS